MRYPSLFILVLLPQILNAVKHRIIGEDYGAAPYGRHDPWLGWIPWTESAHSFERLATPITRYLNGTDYTVPSIVESPDFRLPEPPFTAYHDYIKEENRPYRLSPFHKQYHRYKYYKYYEFIDKLACICTTVFKRLTPLAGCALITTRHLLTTATSTELVLRRYRQRRTLENILGAWYDHTEEYQNSSLYMTPARIHYHPGYATVDRTNGSHPIPCVNDLSVWAATYRFPGPETTLKIQICSRASSGRYHYTSATPHGGDLLMLVGYQYVWAINRKPAPWFKYMVRVRRPWYDSNMCPKSEWGWFICIPGDRFAKLGFDHGGALHASFEYIGYRTDGLIGLNAFSMRLRSVQIMNYFTILDTHTNINFFYAAYMGRLPYQFLDKRFHDTQFKAPLLKENEYIPWAYPTGAFHSNYGTDIGFDRLWN